MKSSQLKDQVVLVTGASSGIGWATAFEFAKHGSRLALAARREDKLKELAATLKAQGLETLVLRLDVSDLVQCRAAVDAVILRWGRVDILVNNAGVMAEGRFHDYHLADVEAVMRTNYLGAAALMHAAIPHMLKAGRGHIVNVASVAGLLGLPYMSSYCASKFALVGLTEALRREYYGSGVTFTSLCPGSVDTPMAAATIQDERVSKLARLFPPKTAGQVARKIVQSCLDLRAELIYGEAPAFLIRLGRFLPRLSDWAIQQGFKRVHPVGRR